MQSDYQNIYVGEFILFAFQKINLIASCESDFAEGTNSVSQFFRLFIVIIVVVVLSFGEEHKKESRYGKAYFLLTKFPDISLDKRTDKEH